MEREGGKHKEKRGEKEGRVSFLPNVLGFCIQRVSWYKKATFVTEAASIGPHFLDIISWCTYFIGPIGRQAENCQLGRQNLEKASKASNIHSTGIIGRLLSPWYTLKLRVALSLPPPPPSCHCYRTRLQILLLPKHM